MSWHTRIIQVVVGIIINNEGKVLIAKRPSNKSSAGLWEFPGGKVEPNEKALSALKRELQEEIGIQVIEAKSWFQTQHAYPDKTIELDNWFINKYEGVAHGAEGQTIKWILPKELEQYTFPEGNKIIIQRLITNPKF